MKYFCSICGNRVFKSKKEVIKCDNCGKFVCPSHAYSYVDGCNIAITKNAKVYCGDCVKNLNLIL